MLSKQDLAINPQDGQEGDTCLSCLVGVDSDIDEDTLGLLPEGFDEFEPYDDNKYYDPL